MSIEFKSEYEYKIDIISEIHSRIMDAFIGLNSDNEYESDEFLEELPTLLDVALCYVKVWCKADDIPYVLLRQVIKLWRENEYFPSIDDIIDYYNDNPCYCSTAMSDENRKAMIRIFLINTGYPPSCANTRIFDSYCMQYNAIPTYNTINSIIEGMSRIFNSDYFDEKIKVGTKNIENIKTYTKEETDDGNCSLCMENIVKSQKYHKLEPCGHCFHANEDDCIGSTIIKWLTDNHTCPNCRKEVIIDN